MKARIFVEVSEVNGDVQVEIVDERDEPSFNYGDDKFIITVYADPSINIDFGIGVYVGMAIAMIANDRSE